MHLFNRILLLCFTWICCSHALVAGNKIVQCFYLSEGSYRLGDDRFTINDINTNLCTHVVYQGLQLDVTSREIIKNPQFYNKNNDHQKLIELQTRNPKLKVLLALYLKPDKWNQTHLMQLTENTNHIDDIAQNVVDFLQKYKFDGIVLQFYPSKEGRFVYMKIIKALRSAFQPYSYLLIALGGRTQTRIDGYDIVSLSQDLDFLQLQVHGFHNPWMQSNWADHPAPLYKQDWDQENESIDFAVNNWINKGFPPDKILLTISLWGLTWMLLSNKTTPPVPAKDPGPPQKYTQISGVMGYFEICKAIQTADWEVFEDSNQTTGPYIVSPAGSDNRTWVGYDNPAIAVVKSEYILSKGLGGVALWDISMDDFRNDCGEGPNPITLAVWKTFNKISSDSDQPNLKFRQKMAIWFSLFVSTCSLITFVYIIIQYFANEL